MAKNGQLPDSALAPVPGGQKLRKDAAQAYRALDAYCRHREGRGLANAGDGACYRRLGRPGDYRRGGSGFTQWYAWERYLAGGNLAARPGSSNHGLGVACDFVTIDLVKQYGSKFGWRKTEAFGEAWHYNFVPGRYPLVKRWSEVRGGQTITRHDHGPGLRAAKKLLARHGYWPWPSFGYGYSRTFGRAVKRFQRANGLPSDGIVGKRTWALLRRPKGGTK